MDWCLYDRDLRHERVEKRSSIHPKACFDALKARHIDTNKLTF